MTLNIKYAHIERERRYLLPVNSILPNPVKQLKILDNYLVGSTLRVRRVDEDGKSVVFKLGQKIRIGREIPVKIAHTTMYLTEGEYEILSALPAKSLSKRRLIYSLGTSQFALDEFDGELLGLALAEIDLGEGGFSHNALPFENFQEVTGDDRFSGGGLAGISAEGIRSLLSEYGVE